MTETIKYKGREWEVIREDTTPIKGSDIYIMLKELNPMPELSEGDWYSYDRIHCYCMITPDHEYVKEDIREIRFADGRPTWRRS